MLTIYELPLIICFVGAMVFIIASLFYLKIPDVYRAIVDALIAVTLVVLMLAEIYLDAIHPDIKWAEYNTWNFTPTTAALILACLGYVMLAAWLVEVFRIWRRRVSTGDTVA